MTAEKKKQRIQVQGTSNYNLNHYINFGWVSSPATGRKQISGFYTCRDYISDDLRSHYRLDGGRLKKDTAAPIDTERLRLLIAIGLNDDTYEPWKQALYDAKRIINIYEELAGFEQRSVITRVDYLAPNGSKSENVEHCWLLTGPPEWVKYSQLVSMVTLIFRIVTRFKQAGDVETLEDVEAYWQRVVDDSKNQSSKFRHVDTTEYLPTCWQKFRMMMTWFDRVFALSGDDAHNPGNNWHSCGGINSLCRFITRQENIDTPMRKAWDEWRKKYNVK